MKVRDGLHGRQAPRDASNDDGLEQWLPVLKARSRSPPTDVATAARRARRVAVAAARARRLHARRSSSTRSSTPRPGAARGRGAQAPASTTRSAAAWPSSPSSRGRRARRARSRSSSQDPALVIAAVRELGLADRPNTCMRARAQGAGRVRRERFAVIDVGTNSVKFHVGERDADGTWRTVADRAEVTRLGEGLDETRPARGRADRANRRGDRRHGGRGDAGTASRRSPPSARPGCGSRSNSGRARRRRARAVRASRSR